MRRALIWLLVAVLLAPAPGAAEEADAVRKALEQMRQQMEALKAQYDQLNERLRRMEAAPRPPAAPTPPAPGPAVTQSPPATTAPPGSMPSAREIIQPRTPFGLYSQRGAGQLLFDLGVAGDFVGNLTQHNVDKAGGGTFAGRENRFFPREVEVSLFGQVDPYARADVRIEAGEEEPGAETSVRLAEATITLLTLPYGTRLKGGQMRNRFGWSNVVHEHDLPWIDRPDVYRIFLGEEGLAENGVEATWLPDLPFYLEVLGGVFNGDNDTAFGRGKLNEPLVTGRVRTFLELTDTSAIQLGASVANGQTPDRLGSTLVGYDVKYKYRPDGWLHPLLTLSSEGIYSIRRVEVANEDETAFEKRTRRRFGWYAGAELQPWRRWALGVRYDSTQYPEQPGWQRAIEPYVTFWPSEFLRFRLAYKNTVRDHRDGFTLDGGSARDVDEYLLQATFILGAHPAHPF